MLSMTLVKRLETYRLEHKITQQAIAQKLGVSFVTVNRWFNSKTTPGKIQQYHIEKLVKGRAGRKACLSKDTR
ncbi:MAG: helix-turn-helix domain-containing protein [Candidatus Omnitrophica bacterium]|nr:helix-turn-helix domain-containing protein [Candidatus Omnitrophota bacterium]